MSGSRETDTPSRASTTRRVRGRATIAVLLVAALAMLAAPTPVSAAPPIVLNANQTAVKNLVNRERQLKKLRILVSRADAQAKAQAWANRLAADGYLHHSVFTQGLTHFCSVGENVGMSSVSVRDVHARFMVSPAHKKNILDPRWTAIGVGYASRGGMIYVVQVFVKAC